MKCGHCKNPDPMWMGTGTFWCKVCDWMALDIRGKIMWFPPRKPGALNG